MQRTCEWGVDKNYMKKCTLGWFSKIVSFLVFGVLLVPMTGYCLYMLFLFPQAPSGDRIMFLAGAIMFGLVVLFAIYRVFYLGLAWVEYDTDNVIFHYSRKEVYGFCWEEVPGSRIQIGPADSGYIFYIQGRGRQRKLSFNRLSKGYKDFEKALVQKGVLHRIGVKTLEESFRDMEQIFEQFQKYSTASPDSVQPKPEGDYVICPDCRGKGLKVKNIVLLKVSKVCETCGGSGYISSK